MIPVRRRHHRPDRNFATLLLMVIMGLAVMVPGTAQAYMLKSAAEVNGPFIHLSDVLADAGKIGTQRVALAPDPGETMSLQLHVIESAMRKAGVTQSLALGNGYISVRRSGREIPSHILEGRIFDAIAAKNGTRSQLNIRITGTRGSLYLPPESDFNRIRIENLETDNRSGRFSATLVVPYDVNAQLRTDISGIAEPVMRVPVLAHALSRGEMVTRHMIDWIELPERRVNRTMVLDVEQLVGMEVQRPLKAGQPLRISDVRHPLMVEKGSLVTMTVVNGALSLSATGKAMQDGAMGETIRLINTSTNRMIEAKVTGAGTVTVTGMSRIASR